LLDDFGIKKEILNQLTAVGIEVEVIPKQPQPKKLYNHLKMEL